MYTNNCAIPTKPGLNSNFKSTEKNINKRMEKPDGQGRTQRLVLVVFPFQGHINPMLQLATMFHSKGFSITIIHPEFNSPNHANHPQFTFIPIADKLSESEVMPTDFVGNVSVLNRNCETPLQQCLEQMMEKEATIRCIVYDSLMHFAQTVANHLKLPGISVRTSAAATLLTYAVLPRLHDNGYISLQDSMSEDQVPDLQSLGLRDLLSTAEIATDAMLELRAAVTNAVRKSSAIIVNTMACLEQQTLPTIQVYFPAPIYLIGPFHKLAPTICTALLKEDTSCISWLDKQAPKSVIYVSFGSMASMNEQELLETAWGLAESEQPFLWVVRPGLVRGSNWVELLPNGFEERVGGRGCIVEWAPQKEVLAHCSVGAFWSHCGWNSTLESICEGVPMLCRPFFGDQFLNAMYLCKVWKVGLEVERELEKGKIGKAIRKLMVETEGEEFRKRVMDLKEKAVVCLSNSGSSYNSLNQLAEQILSF